MEVIRDVNRLTYDKKSAVTVGTFDGVHLGHRKIIEKLNSVRDSKGLRSVIVTFDPHPQIVLRNRATDIKILSTLEEKLEIFKELKVDTAFVINFTKEFSQTTAGEFYNNYLINKIGLSDLILGYDHMFGKNREGNFNTLKELSVENKFTVDKVDEYKFEGQHISSTVLRDLLSNDGNVFKVSKILGRYYSIEGKVVEGKKLGRVLGFPTANIEVADKYKLIPKTGIYTVLTEIEGKKYFGMMSIGSNPTVTDDESIKLEVNIFDFDENIYGKNIKVNFIEKLRDEKKFKSLDELTEQISKDKKLSLEITEKLENKINI
ncbi:MAG TPA: bifunctional riboflavin kinase/FAD synthetase [Ignavibacteria bacterium]|nr:bifunctional riboflavin kinase/FAD synthetase [Ignavibacteria bacterium]